MQEQVTSSISPELQEQHDNVAKNMKLKLYEEDNSKRNESMNTINFEPQTLRSMEEFHALSMTEADLHLMVNWYMFHDLQQQLQAHLLQEEQLAPLLASLHYADAKNGALYFIKQLVPCKLNLENYTLYKTLMIACTH